MRGLPLVPEGRHCPPQRVGVAETRLGPLRHLPGVGAAEISRLVLIAWRHCLGGFPASWSRHR